MNEYGLFIDDFAIFPELKHCEFSIAMLNNWKAIFLAPPPHKKISFGVSSYSD
jgi:hypothetical protein